MITQIQTCTSFGRRKAKTLPWRQPISVMRASNTHEPECMPLDLCCNWLKHEGEYAALVSQWFCDILCFVFASWKSKRLQPRSLLYTLSPSRAIPSKLASQGTECVHKGSFSSHLEMKRILGVFIWNQEWGDIVQSQAAPLQLKVALAGFETNSSTNWRQTLQTCFSLQYTVYIYICLCVLYIYICICW